MSIAPKNDLPEALKDKTKSKEKIMASAAELVEQADQLAAKAINLPEHIKDEMMRNLRKTDPVRHALVKQKMEELRRAP